MMKLLFFLLKRIISMVLVLFGILTVTFFISRVVPGDPTSLFAGPQRSDPRTLENVRKMMGLDKPLYMQFINYIIGVMHGDFGFSWHTGHPVVEDIAKFFPATLELAVVSMVLALLVGLLLGIISAIKKGKVIDYALRFFSYTGVSIAPFWLGLMLLYVFFFRLGWAPPPGRLSSFITPPMRITGLYILDSLLTGNWECLIDSIKHIILPSVCLSYGLIAHIQRLVRASLLEVLQQDYIILARSKGLPERIIIYKHALRNAIIPTVAWTGMAFSSLLGGTIVVECVFAWPGIGFYAFESIINFDYAPVLACTLLFTFLYLVGNLVVDILYAVIDPRIRSAG
jgi:peptide/nickel transport system permease protein